METIRLMHVEDSESDAALVVHLLQKSGYDVQATRIESEQQMRDALNESPWDLVISDYCLPQFRAPDALRLFQEAKLDVPFIVVSGMIGEDVAVQMMKAGAHDYLIKDRMERLPAAVERELREAAIRQQKREADEKLRLANVELEAIYSHAPVLMVVADAGLQVRKINDLAAGFFEKAQGNCIGEPLCGLMRCSHPPPDSIHAEPDEVCGKCALWAALGGAVNPGARREAVEFWSPPDSGSESDRSCLLLSVAPVNDINPEIVMVTAQDITRLKNTERSLQESIASLQSALEENTVLFQEVHHRVKNNLQIVASLLSMKARKDESLIDSEDLKDCERRVRSMALIHDQLYRRKDLHNIDFAAYVQAIAPALVRSFEREGAIDLHLELNPTVISLQKSIPCGLILNELITNVVKYAYPQGHGQLHVQLDSDESEVRLKVIDHGVGLPKVVREKKGSFGTQLIEMLTKQLHGNVEYESDRGTTVSVRFARL